MADLVEWPVLSEVQVMIDGRPRVLRVYLRGLYVTPRVWLDGEELEQWAEVTDGTIAVSRERGTLRRLPGGAGTPTTTTEGER